MTFNIYSKKESLKNMIKRETYLPTHSEIDE